LSAIRATLLVLYSPRLEECMRFYGGLGLRFTPERHGRGPRHYAAVLTDGSVFELYPARPGRETGALRLAFSLPGAATTPPLTPGRHQLADPDGRIVEIEAG
jgi:hypothetical protein